MRITFSVGQCPERRGQFAQWWRTNGLSWFEPVGPIRVDIDGRTITFQRVMDDAQPGDPDFPELRRDTDNDPLTVEQRVPLLSDPPEVLWTPAAARQVA